MAELKASARGEEVLQASFVAGHCWVRVDFNLLMLSERTKRGRCSLRYATLTDAQVACSRNNKSANHACRGIARDNGLQCTAHKPRLRFELRSQQPVERADGAVENGTSWLMLHDA